MRHPLQTMWRTLIDWLRHRHIPTAAEVVDAQSSAGTRIC